MKFQSLYDNGCMDANGGAWNAPVTSAGCNGSSGGRTYQVYRSWGAWTRPGVHRCLYAADGYQERLDICETSAYNQQWTRVSA